MVHSPEDAAPLPGGPEAQLVECLPCGLAVVDQHDVVQFANPAARDMAGCDGALEGVRLTDVIHPDDRARLQAAVVTASVGRVQPPAVECRIQRPDAAVTVVRVLALPYSWEERPAALVLAVDVTELREAEARRSEADRRLRLFLQSSASGIIGLDVEARLTFFNPAAAAILGLKASALGQVGHTLFHHSRADGSPYPATSCPCVAAAREGSSTAGRAETFWHADGRPVPVDFQITPLNGTGSGCVLTFQDVSERLRAEKQVADHAGLLTSVLEALSAQTAVVDRDGTIIEVNKAWAEVAAAGGASPETTGVGANVLAVLDRVEGPERPQAEAAAIGLRAVLDGSASQHADDVSCLPRDGWPTMYSSLKIVPLTQAEGGAVLSYDDITERKVFELQAAHRALHDELTGLPNRALLLDRLEQALRERARDELAVLFIDLDNFKLVNDGYGHQAGDAVLRELARRLRQVVRPADTVARLAGDEFVVICEHLPFLGEACQLAQRLITALSVPFSVAGSDLVLGASVGIASGEDLRLDADGLLRAADSAMFEAKARGRGQFALYDDGIHQRSLDRLEQALSLRRLVESDRLTVHYQPVVDLRDSTIKGVEALLRWRGAGAPDAETSVSLAEETGLINVIGDRVLRQALHSATSFRHRDGSVLGLSVNLAPQQLRQSLVEAVVDAAAEAGFPLSALTLEVTERTIMNDVSGSVDVLRELRTRGVQVAVDDFGVGYSSLAYLRDLPLDVLKIDGTFVSTLSSVTPRDEHIISAIIQLGQALGLRVIAEGVERAHQRTQLQALGCEAAQGFLFGYPQSAADIRLLKVDEPVAR